MKKILNSVVILAALLAACTDYVQEIDNQYDEWNRSGLGNAENNPAVVDPSTVVIGKVTDSRDNQTYKTVTIGAQTWMAENLNYETENSFCYGSADSNCTKYGRLYTWAAAMTACPDGWHLPTKDEFKILFTAVGGQSTAGIMLRSTSGWYDDGNGTDTYVFSALPAGYRDFDGEFRGVNYYADFWSSTENDSFRAYFMDLYYHDSSTHLGGDDDKLSGFSVRCLKGGGSSVTSSFSITPQSNSSETSVSSSSVKSSSSAMSSSSEKAESSSSKAIESAEGMLTDSRDGKTYKTVSIGTQTWMAENLNYEVNYKSNSFCYKDSTKYCAKYGHLYTWDAAMKACPDGWHLPSEDEFNTLFAAVGGQSVAAKMLKSSSGWQDGNGLDNYAFSALPVGRRYPDDGRYYLNGYAAYFWSSTENSSYGANYIYMDDNSDNPEIDNSGLSLAYSVRCLKDEGTTPQSSSSTKISSSSDTPESSSSEAKSSSSSVTPQSSSSEKAESSSSKVTEPAEVTTGTMTDSRDGQTYKIVKIGTQTWMAENLNYEIFGSYCYDYDDSNCAKYGRLYTWATALESCPVGWHLPTKAEFETLFTAVGGKSLAGENLKSRDGWDSDGYGTDTYGFTALPAGYWNYAGGSYQKDREAYFWSSTENSSEYAYYMDLFCNNKNAMMSYLYKKYGYSVRCLKDAQAE